MKGEPMKRAGVKIALPLLLVLAVTAVFLTPHFFPFDRGTPTGAGAVSSKAGSGASPDSWFWASRPGTASSGGEIPSTALSSQAPGSAVSEGAKGEDSSGRVPATGQQGAAPEPSPRTPAPTVTALMPSAPGTDVFSEQGAEVDYSNASHGYFMARYSGSGKIKVLVYFNGNPTYYQYTLRTGGSYATIPLQSGSGSYRVRFMENLGGDMYSEVCSTTIDASVHGTGCFLYPNQYVSYTRSSEAVRKAQSLCEYAYSDSQKTAAIYSYITGSIRYDSAKAGSVTSGYLPDVDDTLDSGKGICFDYAALMAAMCRSQQIPTRLVIGSTSSGYHAWNEVYLGEWKRYDPTFGAAGQTAGSYTPQKYY